MTSEISHPVVDGNDLVYEYKLIEGKMPESGGATALFIDWIGVRGRRCRSRVPRRGTRPQGRRLAVTRVFRCVDP